MQKKVVKFDREEGGRIDSFIAEICGFSRSRAASLCDEGLVLVNGKTARKSLALLGGETIEIMIPEAVELETAPEEIPIEIVYEDDFLLVVNKQKGMVVHPAAGNYSGTLVNALLHHCKGSLSGINGVLRPGIVHRIDKDTSGLLVVAKTDAAHNFLAKQIKDHSVTREYRAILCGRLKEEAFTVDAPLGRHKTDRKKQAVTPGGRRAVSHFELIENLPQHAFVKVRLETGRTHQIRVHSAYIGHPVLGDTVYGAKKQSKDYGGQCLHAARLGFVHPISGEYMEFESDLPEYFKSALTKLS